jgi:hypothetical protein
MVEFRNSTWQYNLERKIRLVVCVNKKVSEKKLLDSDMDSVLYAADAVTDFLDTRLKKPFERYMVARLVCILYETTWDCSLDSELEAKLKGFATQNPNKHSLETLHNTQYRET